MNTVGALQKKVSHRHSQEVREKRQKQEEKNHKAKIFSLPDRFFANKNKSHTQKQTMNADWVCLEI